MKSAFAQNYHDEFFQQNLSFDCKESQLIESLGERYIDSENILSKIDSVVSLTSPFSSIKESFEILTPYCRDESLWLGKFCMAGDIHSAKIVSLNSALLDKIPAAIKLLSKQTQGGKPFNIILTLSKLFAKSLKERRQLVILSSFLGLDDNGVQTSRLMANLIYLKKFKVYSRLFPVFLRLGWINNIP